MQVHFVDAKVPVSALEKQIICSLLLAHMKTIVLALIQTGQTQSAEEAETEAINGVRKYAGEAFPDLTLKILPDATH
jgi:hypothetical protein